MYSETTRHHEHHTITTAGILICAEKRYFGASLNSIIVCKVCGKGLLEVKCPFCFKDGIPNDGEEVPGFCIEKKNGMW